MIVQTAADGAPHFVMKMKEHAAFAGRMARAFGNDRFQAIEPRDLALYAIDHHDYGWIDFDDKPERNPETGLPYNLVGTPRRTTIATLNLGPDFNERHHPYCGLLVTMHMYGVYTGRYGLSERILIDRMQGEARQDFETVLNGLLNRQNSLKESVAADPATAELVADDGPLMQNYKQLQLFDQLALYFNYLPPADRKPAEYRGVPRSADEDVTVHISPVDEATYAFDPFPFLEDGIEVYCDGRYLLPVEGDDGALGEAMRRTPTERQTMHFVAD